MHTNMHHTLASRSQCIASHLTTHTDGGAACRINTRCCQANPCRGDYPPRAPLPVPLRGPCLPCSPQ